MGQSWNCGCQTDQGDRGYTLEPENPGNTDAYVEKMPRFDEDDLHTTSDQDSSKNNSMTNKPSTAVVRKKARNFSEKYDKGKQIGTGPFGNIFHCWIREDQLEDAVREDTGTIVEGKRKLLTLKILKKNLLSQKPALDDLLVNEFRVLMDARHPNIIRMYDIFQDRQNFFVVQESLEGEDLYSALSRIQFTEEQAISIIRQTCLALKFLHEQNIVHRDVKSDNIILLENEDNPGEIQVKINDFGLAAKIDPAIGGLRGFAGTPEYMAPEVVRQPGNKSMPKPDPLNVPLITQKADIFALGVLAYEVLTGYTAFTFACKSSIRLYQAIKNKEPQFKEEVFQYCTEDCIDFIKQCLIKDQEYRPSIHDVLNHSWLNQFDTSNQMMQGSSFIDNRLTNNMSFKERHMEASLDRQQAGDFVKLLFAKMSWIRQSQQNVLRLAEVFRLINISGSGFLTKVEVFHGLADNYGDMGFSEAEWESMFELMEVNQDDFFNFQSYINGVSAYQRGINQTKIRETFHMLDVKGDGMLDLYQLRMLLQDELQTGESGASVSEDAQVWLQILEELERDGERPISYTDFYDAILVVIQRSLADEIIVATKRDVGLRQSIILQA